MIPTVHEDEDRRGRTRYALTETEHGHSWGVCAEAEGLFGEPRRGIYELFGWLPQDEPGLYLALGEAVNGPGGYFGGCLAALDDCLRGTFGYTAPATLLWRDAVTAREHLSQALAPDGQPYDLFGAVLDVLDQGGMHVTLA